MTTNVPNLTPTAVQNAINGAHDGDSVCVPSGSASWGANAITINKGIRLKGAAAWTNGTTTITLSGLDAITIQGNGKYLEVSGFTFSDNASGEQSNVGPIDCSGMFRVCSNIFNNCNHPIIVTDSSVSPSLIDRNTATITGANGSFIDIMGGGPSPISAWDHGTTYGTTNYCYIEHNIITSVGGFGDGVFDAYGGAKFVFRYNLVTNGYWGWHGCDTGDPAGDQGWSVHSYEIYGNHVYYNNGGNYCIFNSRGGTGLVFSNTVSGRSNGGDAVYFQYYRAPDSQGYPQGNGNWGAMNGSNPNDGNIGPPAGWPGLCQQGTTGPTTGYAKAHVGTKTTQVLSPTYVWGNDSGYTVGADTVCIKAGRDWTNIALLGYVPLRDPHPWVPPLVQTVSGLRITSVTP